MSRFTSAVAALALFAFGAGVSAAPASATTSGDHAWVATWRDQVAEVEPLNSVQLVNLTNGDIARRIQLDEIRPSELAYSASAGKLWAISQGWSGIATTLEVIDTETGEYHTVMADGEQFAGPDDPFQFMLFFSDNVDGELVASPDGSKIFVTGNDPINNSGAVLVFDAKTEDFLGGVTLAGDQTTSLAVNSTDNLLYATTRDGNNIYIETIDMDATDWETAAIDVSPILDWDGDTCSNPSSLAYSSVTGWVYATCTDVSGVGIWFPYSDEVNGVTVEDMTQILSVTMSQDGETIALGTCYNGAFTLQPDFSSGTYINFNTAGHQDLANQGYMTSKPVMFFDDGAKYVAGSWNNFISTYDVGSTTATDYYLEGPDGELLTENDPSVYISAIIPADDPALAETGTDATPLALAGFALVALGAVVAIRRRQRV